MSDLYGVPRRRIVGETWFWILMVIAIMAVLAIGGFAIRWATAPVKGKLQAREQINSGGNRIQATESFYNSCRDALSAQKTVLYLEAQLKSQKAELADERANNDDTSSTLDDISVTLTNITANKATFTSAVNDYNAKAKTTFNEGKFLPGNLPRQLPTTIGGLTTCGT